MTKKKDNLFWGEDTGSQVVKSAWKGTKMVAGVVVAGLALGLGLGAMNSVSSN